MVRAWCLFGLLVVSGCAQQRAAEAYQAGELAIAACRQQYPGKGMALAISRCSEPARRNTLSTQGMPPDLIDYLIANQAVLSAALDRGEITREEAGLREAQGLREASETILRRQNAFRASRLPLPQMQFGPPPSRTTNCTMPDGRFQTQMTCVTQ